VKGRPRDLEIHETREPVDLREAAELGDRYLRTEQIRRLVMLLGPAWFCGIIVIARQEGKVVGFNVALRTSNPRIWFLPYILVKPSHAHRQVGSRIHRKAESALAGKGVRWLVATVSPDNYPSLAMLVNEYGWRGIRFLPGFYGKRRSRLLVVKDLAQPHQPNVKLESKGITVVRPNDWKRLVSLINRKRAVVCRIIGDPTNWFLGLQKLEWRNKEISEWISALSL
jgi:GNAT superfamily N-acetyltransferase